MFLLYFNFFRFLLQLYLGYKVEICVMTFITKNQGIVNPDFCIFLPPAVLYSVISYTLTAEAFFGSR